MKEMGWLSMGSVKDVINSFPQPMRDEVTFLLQDFLDYCGTNRLQVLKEEYSSVLQEIGVANARREEIKNKVESIDGFVKTIMKESDSIEVLLLSQLLNDWSNDLREDMYKMKPKKALDRKHRLRRDIQNTEKRLNIISEVLYDKV